MASPIGELIHRVRFEKPGGYVPDGDGGYAPTWEQIGPDVPWFVKIRPATVRDLESETAGTVSAQASHIVTGKWLAGITPTSRMVRVRDNRIFQINGVANDDERDETMTIFCTELLDPDNAGAKSP